MSPLKNTNSPYAIDRASNDKGKIEGKIFFDGVFKGDYSLAIVNRYLARSLVQTGLDLTLHSAEEGWEHDRMLNEMPDVRSRCVATYPPAQIFDIHLRNTWPPRADDMVGRRLNAYVCFAWEELEVPRNIIDHFNTHLDLIMVTANFVEEALKNSGIKIPISVVGDGVDHIIDFMPRLKSQPRKSSQRRVLHISSCFPRKGADLLVKAFAESFSKSDNVELVIKTFDNPHNTIDHHVELARQTYPMVAPIRVVKQSMPYPELVDLMLSSDLLVAPSRGEGFGLPLAEAILLGVPVVTTGYSGQTDFCTDSTAWLVKYRMVPSTAHVAKAGALWAEPDIAELGVQMRRALTNRAASRSKIDRGQALLKAHFKWSDVARRVTQSLNQALSKFATDAVLSITPDIRIDLVSTWRQVCGIATYSEHLFSTPSLGPTLARVLARELRGDELTEEGSPPIIRPWGYDTAGIRRLEASLSASRSDVIWFQHHPAFFSDEDMLEITESLERSPYRLKVVTLHNVKDTIANKPAAWLKKFDVVIVHTQQDADLLADRGAEVSMIPHGILAHEAPPREQVATFTVGTFGFLYPHKNIPLLVQAFALARSIEPRLRLKLLNCVRKDPVAYKERVRVENLVVALGIGDVVEMDFGFLGDSEIIARLSQCDLICFPYGESTESTTGAARIALAADRPLLCSQSNVLGDILPFALVLARPDPTTLADALLTLSASPVICQLRDTEREAYIERHTYPAIAERHLKLLKSRLRGD